MKKARSAAEQEAFALRQTEAGLHEVYQRILKHIYLPKNYYRRARTFLREYRALTVKTAASAGRLAVFGYAMLRLVIVGRERWEYWKLLTWTVFRRPNLLPEAVTLMISGYHFRRVAERHVFAPR